jgi:hypothetical protein
MKPRIYVETSIISYLAARPSRDLILAGHQQITHQWWAQRRVDFELFASEAVVNEASAGDADAARRRLEFLGTLPLLDITDDVSSLVGELIRLGPIPPKSVVDAVHVAVSAVYGLEYLLTWNCSHLANAKMRTRINQVCVSSGYRAVVICTPEELMEE